MQIKKKQVILQSFLMTHLQTPTQPRSLAWTHQEGNAKNWPRGLLEDLATKNSSRREGPSGNCELSVICGHVNIFGLFLQ